MPESSLALLQSNSTRNDLKVNMPTLSTKHLQEFRREFRLPDRNLLRWFPGHMAGGLKKMQTKLKSVDCIIEVHDARIPISGRNPNFKYDLLGVKPHILVLNKTDLTDTNFINKSSMYLKEQEGISEVIFTNCKDQTSKGIKDLVPSVINTIKKFDRFNRCANPEFGVMIIGIPNVGKSSLINSLRSSILKKNKCAPVGAKPGITKLVQNRIKISNSPPVFVYDTPGILTPNVPHAEVGMKLALCGTLQDHSIGLFTIADFLLYWCNKNKNFNYLDFFGINEPSDNIGLLLAQYAIKKNIYIRIRELTSSNVKVNKPDLNLSANRFIEAFRNGKLGPINLDSDTLKWYKS
ncbi:hypothetical protein PGB90_009147 [Kerria lacca]